MATTKKPPVPKKKAPLDLTPEQMDAFKKSVHDAIELEKSTRKNVTIPSGYQSSQLRNAVRGRHNAMRNRVRTGNRLIALVKTNRGIGPGAVPKEKDDNHDTEVLAGFLETFKRISDGVAHGVATNKDMASVYAPDEIFYAREYIRALETEQDFDGLVGKLVKDHPMWSAFFESIEGVGTWGAGVMLSELDIRKASSSSAMFKYAGLDVVPTFYTLHPVSGKKTYLSQYEADLHPGRLTLPFDMLGRTNKRHHLVRVSYDTGKVDDEGKPIMAMKDSITFNPFLKTTLLGVMFENMVKAKQILIDGKRTGAALRLKLATEHGYLPKEHGASSKDLLDYLSSKGFIVQVSQSKYLKVYEDKRIQLMQKQTLVGAPALTPAHIRRRLIRYPMKQLIIDFYLAWCEVEGITPTIPYAEKLLGRTHHHSADDKRIGNAIAAEMASDPDFNSELDDDPLLGL